MIRPGLAQLRRFEAFVGKRLGLASDPRREALLAEVLVRRASACRSSVEDYLATLPGAGPEEIGALAEALTVGETYFFRHTAQFEVFADVILPALMAASPEQPLRVLSAGCASGEEAYSLAIVCAERLTPQRRAFQVEGVDVNPVALAKARAGRYPTWSMRETSAERASRWFRREDNTFVIADELRAVVTFTEANLVEGNVSLARGPGHDAIFCRNVLIYLTEAAARAVVAHLGRTLRPGGFLVLGHAESLRGLSGELEPREEGEVFFYQRRATDASPAASSSERPWLPPPAPASAPPGGARWIEEVQSAHDRIVALSARARGAEPRSDARLGGDVELGPVLEHLRRERYQEGLALLSSMDDVVKAAPDVLLLRAVLHLQTGETALAEPLCQRVLLDPARRTADQAAAHYLLALARESAGDLPLAREHLEMSAHLDPSFAMARLHLGLLARRAGDHRAAARDLEEAAQLLPHENELRLLLFGGGFGREALLAVCRAPRERDRSGRGGHA